MTARRTSRNGDAAAACLGPDGNPAVGDALGARGRPGTKRGFPGSPRSTDSVVPAGSASRFVSREGPKRVCLSPTRGETRRWSTLRHGVRPFKGFRVSRAVLDSEKIRIYAAGETGQLRPGFVKICVCAETAIEFLCWAVAAALSAAHCACGFACGLQGRGSHSGDGDEKDLVRGARPRPPSQDVSCAELCARAAASQCASGRFAQRLPGGPFCRLRCRGPRVCSSFLLPPPLQLRPCTSPVAHSSLQFVPLLSACHTEIRGTWLSATTCLKFTDSASNTGKLKGSLGCSRPSMSWAWATI